MLVVSAYAARDATHLPGILGRKLEGCSLRSFTQEECWKPKCQLLQILAPLVPNILSRWIGRKLVVRKGRQRIAATRSVMLYKDALD